MMNEHVRAARFTRDVHGEAALPQQEPQAGRVCSLLTLALFRWKKNDPVLLFCHNISMDGLMFVLKNVKKPGGRTVEWQEVENEDCGSFHWRLPPPWLFLVFFLVAMLSRVWGIFEISAVYYGWEAARVFSIGVAGFTSEFYGDGYVIAGTCFNAS